MPLQGTPCRPGNKTGSRTGFLFHPGFLDHRPGSGHPESPDRLEFASSFNGLCRFSRRLVCPEVLPVPGKWLEQVHEPSYIRRLEEACRSGRDFLDGPDTFISPATFRAALLAAGAVVGAIDAVVEGRLRNAFCAVRPPGHHAGPDMARGFCFFNNVALGARYLRERYGVERIFIVDWDVHHGNGTQEFFEEDRSVFFFSVHRYPHYPGTGAARERGRGAGLGYTLNVPLAAGSGDNDYLKVFREELEPALLSFAPGFILVSAGFDACAGDPLGGMSVTPRGFARMTSLVLEAARRSCEGRLVSVLEGGYAPRALARCVSAHLAALAGLPGD